MLNIIIPTYNRPYQLSLCLISVMRNIKILDSKNLTQVRVVVRNNSTKFFEENSRVEKYARYFFENYGVKFEFIRTGVDIGSGQNCTTSYLDTLSGYIWLLPDDDIMGYGSLNSVINLTKDSLYSVLIATPNNVQRIPYSFPRTSINKPSDYYEYSVQELFDFDALKSTGLVEAQNYVFSAEVVSKYFRLNVQKCEIDEYSPLLMLLLATYLRKPYVIFSKSIGIFRADDPNSEWRHRWLRWCSVEFYNVLKCWNSIGLITHNQKELLKYGFFSSFSDNWFRVDILFNFWNPRFPFFWELIALYRKKYFDMVFFIFKNPLKLIKAIRLKLTEKKYQRINDNS